VPEQAAGGRARGKDLVSRLPVNGQVMLVVDGLAVAPLTVAVDPAARRRGLIGQTKVDGALLLPGVRAVHTIAMRLVIDVAYLDPGGAVVEITRMRRWRIGRQRREAAAVLEAAAGSFERWGLHVGSVVSSLRVKGDGF
jgi:uncharacterized protein